jgi:hypothetical protein
MQGAERARQLLAQEAARIIVNHGVRDYRAAKTKAAEKLGFRGRGALPGNAEIERAVSEHLQLFGRESHADLLSLLRKAALSAMALLAVHTPRLVGPVLSGTADGNSAVNLHVFADSAEQVAGTLEELGIAYRPYERRLKHRRDELRVFAGFQFDHDGSTIEATVFPVDGIRQAPISPIDGKPMRRADDGAVAALLRDGGDSD